MFKRKKLNFFVAMIMVMTLMFGSTMCLAAEKNDVSENRNEIIQARTQSMSGVYKFTENEKMELKNKFHVIDDDRIPIDKSSKDIYVRLYWAWDEGYTGYFRDAELVNLTSGELAGFSFSKTGNSSYITVNVSYKYGGKLHSASQQYYVDEYGSVY